MRQKMKTMQSVQVNENDVSPLVEALCITKVLENFDLFYLDFSSIRMNYGARYMEKDFAEGVLALCYNQSNGLEMLVRKDPGNERRLKKAIQKLTPEKEEAPELTQIKAENFENQKEQETKGNRAIVLRLLLYYATTKGKPGLCRGSNLTGHEFLFFESPIALEKKGNNRHVITALQINVTDEKPLTIGEAKRCDLTLSAVGFFPWDPKNPRYANRNKYRLDPATGEFCRVYPSEMSQIPKKTVLWTQGNYPGEHATLKYLNSSLFLKLGDEYNSLLAVLACLETWCGDYFAPGALEQPFRDVQAKRLNPVTPVGKSAARAVRKKGYPGLGSIALSDDTGDEKGQNTLALERLRKQVLIALQCAGVEEQKRRVSVGEEDTADTVISLVHTRQYYEDQQKEDPYLVPHTARVVQHLYLETLEEALRTMQEKERKAVEKGKRLQPESRLSPEISRVLDECLIKQEIVRGRLSLWDWKHTGTWHFVAGYHQGKDSYGKKRGKAFDLLACMEQREDNTCSFATMDELEHGKKQMSVDATTVKHVLGWFEGRKEYGRHPECAVVTPSGHCFLIMRLDNRFLLPEKKTYESIMDRLPEGKVNLRRKGSLTLKDGTVVEDPLDLLFGALTNINVWNAENGHAVLYTSGIIPENLRDNRPSFARACIMRAIVAEDGSEVDQDDPEIQAILDALWMPLIRSTRDPSVLPFQAKYCREYLRLCGAYEKAYREEDKYFDE